MSKSTNTAHAMSKRGQNLYLSSKMTQNVYKDNIYHFKFGSKRTTNGHFAIFFAVESCNWDIYSSGYIILMPIIESNASKLSQLNCCLKYFQICSKRWKKNVIKKMHAHASLWQIKNMKFLQRSDFLCISSENDWEHIY